MVNMILIINPNINIDRTYTIPGFRAGAVFRPETVQSYANGKGVNVARIMLLLGADPLVVGFTGGSNGRFIRESLIAQGIPAELTEVEGESRINSVIVDARSAKDTVINEPGPELAEDSADLLLQSIEERIAAADLVIAAGSLPRGLSPRLYVESIRMAQKHNKRFILDASGENLRLGLEAGPYMVKPNEDELTGLLGALSHDPAGMAEAVRSRITGSTRAFLVTLGERGALLITEQETVFYRQPDLPSCSCTGCGDACLGGVGTLLSIGEDLRTACRLGIAAAAANTLMPGPGLCRLSDIRHIEGMITEEIVS
ncbi:MAG: 1-phosphofructokinase family hexose kinase [bacterium]|nr:1-phosphofructokinase family hexose kinase [bacterium]